MDKVREIDKNISLCLSVILLASNGGARIIWKH